MKICILDSGVNTSRFPDAKINGIGINVCGGQYETVPAFQDELGHGTAITSIILQEYPDAEIFCVKIFDTSMQIDADRLVFAVSYVAENIDCDLLNISAGITLIQNYSALQALIGKLMQKGIFVISAFDNDGVMSYPAAMPEVIGVDTGRGLKGWVLHEDDVIDVIVPEKYYRVKWVNPDHTIIKGTSFACAQVTGVIAGIIAQDGKTPDSKRALKAKLQKSGLCGQYRTGTYGSDGLIWNQGKSFVHAIKKAVAFPFNKEIHALAANEESIPFSIEKYLDVRLGGKCAKTIHTLCPHIDNQKVIENIDSLDWGEDFDTLILGHCGEISDTMNRPFLSEIATLCQNHHKRLYAFDALDGLGFDKELQSGQFFYPTIRPQDVPRFRYDKLRYCAVPVLGIMGTSSQQGKFTLQNRLRREITGRGYSVSSVSTEPNGYLLQHDGVYPMGYSSTILVDRTEAVCALNEMIWEVTDRNESELFLIAGQSGTIPFDNGNLNRYTFWQHGLLSVLRMDCCLLCVNAFDRKEYIAKTIQYIESLSAGRVVALILFPVTYQFNKLGYAGQKVRLSDDELLGIKKELQDTFSLPVFLNSGEISEITDCCIDYLSAEQTKS